MANVTLPVFPALTPGALFVKGVANDGGTGAGAQYVTFGHAFQIGQLPAGQGLSANFGAGAVPCQVDVKTRYSDGSAAFALVSVQAPAVPASTTAWGQFSPASPPTGSPLTLATALAGHSLQLALTATSPAATFSQDLAALAASATPNLWLSGPLAVQGRAAITLPSPLQTMRAIVDFTAYADGSIAAIVHLANDIGTFVVSGASSVGGTVAHKFTLTLDGVTVYSSAALTQYLFEKVVVGVGLATPRIVANPADFIAAQAVQSYNLTIGVDPSKKSAAQGYTSATGFGVPLVNPVSGSDTLVDFQMGDVGGRPDIGINDAWCAWWFITQDPVFWAVAKECCKVCQGIPWHYFNTATSRYVTTDDYPTIWTDLPTYQEGQYGNYYLLKQTADPNWALDSAHFPELVYLQYLHTGRRDYLDELNAIMSWLEVSNWPDGSQRNNDQGLFLQNGQVRQGAWGLRNCLYAAYGNPDGSPEKAYAVKMLGNNLAWCQSQLPAWKALQGPACYGYVPPWNYGVDRANWEQAYWASSMELAAIQGSAAALAILNWMSNYLVGIWNQSSNGFPTIEAVAYENQVFANGQAWDGTTKPLQTYAAIEAATFAAGYSLVVSEGPPVVTSFSTSQGAGPAQGDYGQLQWIALANLVTLGIAGAASALSTLQTLTDSSGAPVPFIDAASWAIGPLVQVTPRTWNASQVLATGAVQVPTISSVSLSPTTITAGLPAGSTVGAVSVTMSDASTFAGSLSLSGSAAADFSLSGSNLLTAVSLAAGSYGISITATPTDTSISPLTQGFTVVAQAASVSISAINLSANTFAFGAPAGTVVGAISVVMSDSSTFSGSLSLSGTNAASFAVSGSNLVTVGALQPGSYSLSIVATQDGVSNSPFSQAETITGAQPTVAQLEAEIAAAQAALATAQTDLAASITTATAKLAAISTAVKAISTSQVQNVVAAIAAAQTAVTAAQTSLSGISTTLTADLQAIGSAL